MGSKVSDERLHRATRIAVRCGAVVLVHWLVGGALGLGSRSVPFDVLAMACPLLALGWVVPALVPAPQAEARRTMLRISSVASALGLVALTILAAHAWRAHGPAGAPPFVSPLEFGARWLALF